jgi:hypothetical protein
MAITQVANPSSVPSAVADYEAQNAHISAFNNIVNNQPFILTNSGGTGLPAIKLGTYIQYGGNLYVVDTEDYAITGTPVDGNNYIRLSGSTTLTAEWVQDISSYAWNEVYGYKELGSYFLLPYLVVKSGTEYYKKFVINNLSSIGGIYEISSTGIFTVPQHDRIYALTIGGGGGGGKVINPTYFSGGAGGRSGEVEFSEIFPATNSVLSITIGAGGVGASATSTGGDGGDSYITDSGGDIILQARGGAGGLGYRESSTSIGRYAGGDGFDTLNGYSASNGESASITGYSTIEIGGFVLDNLIGGGGGGGAYYNGSARAAGTASDGGGDGGSYGENGHNATSYGGGGGGAGGGTSSGQFDGGNGYHGVVYIVVV